MTDKVFTFWLYHPLCLCNPTRHSAAVSCNSRSFFFLSRQVCERLDTHLLSILRESKFRPLRQEVPRRSRMDWGHPERKLSPAWWRWSQLLGNREDGLKKAFFLVSCCPLSSLASHDLNWVISSIEFEEMLASDNVNVLPVKMDCLTVCTARLVVSVRSPCSLPTSPSCGERLLLQASERPALFSPRRTVMPTPKVSWSARQRCCDQ